MIREQSRCSFEGPDQRGCRVGSAGVPRRRCGKLLLSCQHAESR